jgi:hypothetical protein
MTGAPLGLTLGGTFSSGGSVYLRLPEEADIFARVTAVGRLAVGLPRRAPPFQISRSVYTELVKFTFPTNKDKKFSG